jgi:hypothetical protein
MVPQGTWVVSAGFIDNNGNAASTSVELPGTLTYAQAETEATGWAGLLILASDARLASLHISKFYINDDVSAIAASSEVERKLVLTFDAGAHRNAVTVKVPSPIFEMEQARTDVPNAALPAFANLVAFYTGGMLGAGNGPVTYFGADITALSKAVVRHRASGKAK